MATRSSVVERGSPSPSSHVLAGRDRIPYSVRSDMELLLIEEEVVLLSLSLLDTAGGEMRAR